MREILVDLKEDLEDTRVGSVDLKEVLVVLQEVLVDLQEVLVDPKEVLLDPKEVLDREADYGLILIIFKLIRDIRNQTLKTSGSQQKLKTTLRTKIHSILHTKKENSNLKRLTTVMVTTGTKNQEN